ncbi:DUF6603 domain-containing protein [Gymnodinialimonas sp.]
MASISASSLTSWLEQIGVLVNLLTTTDDGFDVNEAWFEHPWGDGDIKNIDGVPQRPEVLFPLVDAILGPAATGGGIPGLTDPAGNTLNWYPINFGETVTGVSLVMSDPTASFETTPGDIGVGMQHTFTSTSAKGSVDVFGYAPIYALLTGGDADFALAGADTPLTVSFVVNLDTPAPFESSSVSKITITGFLSLADKVSPSFEVDFFDADDTKLASATSLTELIGSSIEMGLDTLLQTKSVTDFLNSSIGETSLTVGQLLVAGLLLQENSGVYTLADYSAWSDKSALQIAAEIVFHMLDELSEEQSVLIPMGNGGLYVVAQQTSDTATDYGLRICLPDYALGKVAADDSGTTEAPNEPDTGANKNKPQLTLQIGKWLTGEDDYANSWISRSVNDTPATEPTEAGSPNDDPTALQPGVSVMLIEYDTAADQEIAFAPRLEFVSVGVDYIGTNGNPLLDVAGVTLGGIELRGLVSLNLSSTPDLQIGGAARLDDLGIPLGTSFDAADTEGDNPTAANSVASGDGEGGNATTDATDPVNPPFSVSAAYVVNDYLAVQLYDENNAPTDIVWFSAQEALGPVHLSKLGVGWDQSEDILSFIVDGGVSLLGLTVDLVNLSIGIPVTHPFTLSDYTLGLDGIGVDFKEGPIEISGSFLENKASDPVDYEGEAMLRLWHYAISAYGAYANDNGSPSLFVYALMDAPLGGIPAFFLKGLTGGFGYNRTLTLPGLNEVEDFPLVAALADPSILSGGPTAVLETLDNWIAPSRGEYWLSGGLAWTTYDIVNANVLASVEFGNDFEIGLLGIATMALPQNTDKHLAYVGLDIDVTLDIGADEFLASAVLSPDSFLLDPKFKLTGGFALQAWWSDNAHSGDLVISLGGYSPTITVPDYYPELARLGFSFSFAEDLSMNGDLYFALTTSNVMVGGEMQFTFDMAGMKLWFSADIDAFLYWQPAYLDVHMSVTAGASYTVSLFGSKSTLQVEANGEFDFWAAPSGGKIALDFWFISLPFSFGAPEQTGSDDTVCWDEFETMLPPPVAQPTTNLAVQPATALAEEVTTGNQANSSVVTVTLSGGLLYMFPETSEDIGADWVIRADAFCFSTATVIPASEILLCGASVATSDAEIGARPLGVTLTDTTLAISIKNSDCIELDASQWQATTTPTGAPSAVWGTPVSGKSAPKSPDLVDGCLLGATTVLAPHATLSGPPAFPASAAFAYIPVDPGAGPLLPLESTAVPATSGAPTASTASDSTLEQITNIASTDVSATRDQIFAALAELGADAGQNGDLSIMAATPSGVFSAAPMAGQSTTGGGA